MNCFFFDIDGTIYNRKFHEVSENLILAFKQLQKNGNKIALATSRCMEELKHLPSCLRLFPFDFYILDGGALVLDQNFNILDVQYIDTCVVENINQFCLDYALTYRYSTKDGNYWGTKPDESWHILWNNLYLTTPIFMEYKKDDCINILVQFKNMEQEKMIQEICKNCSLIRYYDCYEVRKKDIDKATIIHNIKLKYHFDTIYCFGDGHNDVDMLKIADVGIAVGNACKECKEVANIVIDSIDNDGIYKYLLKNNLCKEV